MFLTTLLRDSNSVICVCAQCADLMCVNFGVKSTHFDRKTTRFDLQNQIPTHFQTISPRVSTAPIEHSTDPFEPSIVTLQST